MAITEVKRNVNINSSKVEFICPVCKAKKLLEVPNSVIAEAKQLTTMSIAKGLVCDHQFQAFVDKNFQVRGYQKVDFEFESKAKREIKVNSNYEIQDDSELFKNLILEGNYLEYNTQKLKINNKKFNRNEKIPSQNRDMTIKEIYDEFWEFIDIDNEQFKDLINTDERRNQIPLLY